MKLAISSIAWTNEEELEVAMTLEALGVKYVEIAPTKLWESPLQATDEEIKKYRDFWSKFGIEIVAFQSMLFNRPDLKIFESKENREGTKQYLVDYITLAGKMGAQALVFGSPKNRQKGEMSNSESLEIAVPFFRELGSVAEQNNTSFCIEPNPTDYACDFVTNAKAGSDIVRSVGNQGFGLHLDIAGMTLAGDGVADSIRDNADILTHFHISSPSLELVEARSDVAHEEAAKALHDIGYQGFVSIEMRPGENGSNVQRVKKAVEFAQNIYSS